MAAADEGHVEMTETEVGAMADFEVEDPTEDVAVDYGEETAVEPAPESEPEPDLSTGAVEGDEAQELGKPPEPAPTEKPVVEAAPAEPAPVAAAPAVEPEVAPAPAPVEQTPEEKADELAALTDRVTQQLVDSFEMSEDEEIEFATNPKTFLAKAFAKVRMESFQATFHAIANQIPQMMTAQQAQQATDTEHEAAFYGRWPALQDAQHTPSVLQAIQFYRGQNPNATPEQVIENAGAMASAMLGLASQAPAAPAAAPAAPTPPGTRRTISRTPYTPSGQGASGVDATAPKKNDFEVLAEFMEVDS